jgi:hypothetical protein
MVLRCSRRQGVSLDETGLVANHDDACMYIANEIKARVPAFYCGITSSEDNPLLAGELGL